MNLQYTLLLFCAKFEYLLCRQLTIRYIIFIFLTLLVAFLMDTLNLLVRYLLKTLASTCWILN